MVQGDANISQHTQEESNICPFGYNTYVSLSNAVIHSIMESVSIYTQYTLSKNVVCLSYPWFIVLRTNVHPINACVHTCDLSNWNYHKYAHHQYKEQ